MAKRKQAKIPEQMSLSNTGETEEADFTGLQEEYTRLAALPKGGGIKIKRKNKLLCLQWNLCGIAAQTKSGDAKGLGQFLKMWDADIILLNEIKAQDDALKDILTIRRRFEFKHVSSTLSINNQSMRGTAILYRNRPTKFTVTGSNFVTLEDKGDKQAIEIIYIDVKMTSTEKKYRFICCYVVSRNKRNFDSAMQQIMKWANEEGIETIVTGDFNMNKSKYSPLFAEKGFIDTPKAEWATNKNNGSTSQIDYVMRHSGFDQSRILCHKPQEPTGCVNAHFPIPFVVGEGANPDSPVGYCTSSACIFKCHQ